MFQTEVGNFSVVEIDGSLDVTMAPGEGTVKSGENGIKVRENDKYFVASALVEDSFVSGKEPAEKTDGKLWHNGTKMKVGDGLDYDADATLTPGKIYRNATEGTYYVATSATAVVLISADGADFISGASGDPTNEKLWFNGTSMKVGNGSAFVDASLSVGSVYHDTVTGGYYVATTATLIEPVTKNPAVLTHGSVAHTGTHEGHAYVIDADDTSSFIDRDTAATDNWIQRANVVVHDATPADTIVDVYNAVSWTMTFTYSFSSDTAPVGVYLDLAKSEFNDVADPSPSFRKNLSDVRKTSKGFRIGFYDESTAHDVVWGNNTPLTAVPTGYAASTEYAKGAVVRNTDGKIYKAKAAIASSAATLVADQWEQIGELLAWVSGTSYKVGDRVINGGKVYQCITANNDASFTASKWEDLDPTVTPYSGSETYAIGNKVTNDGKTYKCKVAINPAEGDFDPAHWDEIHDVKLNATAEYAEASSYNIGDVVQHGGHTYKCKENSTTGAWASAKWDRFDDTADLRYVSDVRETTLYTANNYVTTDHGYKRLENLNANETQTWAAGNAAERVCTLTTASPTVTVHCAAWFEGTDPNVVTGAAMECLKANMTFYARTVNA